MSTMKILKFFFPEKPENDMPVSTPLATPESTSTKTYEPLLVYNKMQIHL